MAWSLEVDNTDHGEYCQNLSMVNNIAEPLQENTRPSQMHEVHKPSILSENLRSPAPKRDRFSSGFEVANDDAIPKKLSQLVTRQSSQVPRVITSRFSSQPH